MINVLVVDDEPLAIDVLTAHIQKIPDLHLVTTCNSALEANAALKEHDIDLMFLDIQMPQITGVDFLKTLTDPPQVIFTTAYSEYAVEGYELNALDYLLKPVSFERFAKAVNKAKEQISLERGQSAPKPEPADAEFMFVKADKKLVKIEYDDVIYIEGLKDYVIIRQTEGRVITLQTMKSLEQKLPATIFQRIHRSYIVNVNRIDAIQGNTVEVTERGKTATLPVGKNYRDALSEVVERRRI